MVSAGDRVSAGEAVVVVEAMKMENEMRSPKDGIVRDVAVKEGAAVEAGTVLIVIDSRDMDTKGQRRERAEKHAARGGCSASGSEPRDQINDECL